MKRDSVKLKKLLAGKWLDALKFVSNNDELAYAADHVGESVPCPIAGGTDGFRFFEDANETGGAVKHAGEVFPDGFALLMWLKGWTFPETFDALEKWLLGEPLPRCDSVVQYRPKPKVNHRVHKWLKWLWGGGMNLDDNFAYASRAYFSRRKVINAALQAKDLRAHSKVKYKDRKTGKTIGLYPAFLARIRDGSGKPIALNRTYVTTSGFKVQFKNPQNKAKKATPAYIKSKGWHVRLFDPVDGFLGITEGIETALAIYEAVAFPTWATLANTNFNSFVVPEGVHTIVIWEDKDRNKTGENSAKKLADRLEKQGIRVIRLSPLTPILATDEKGVDWADQLIRDKTGFNILFDALNKLAA